MAIVPPAGCLGHFLGVPNPSSGQRCKAARMSRGKIDKCSLVFCLDDGNAHVNEIRMTRLHGEELLHGRMRCPSEGAFR